MYKFSLVLATYGRENEVKLFLDSLRTQSYKDFELIIVDQNDNDYVKKLCEEYETLFRIKYIHSQVKGLSIARNLGLQKIEGEIVAFPDDDCEYKNDTLETVNNFFLKNEVFNIFSCKSIDKETGCNSNNSRWFEEDTVINRRNIFRTAISYTIFIKFKNKLDIIFDEKLGVGSYYGSSEETDLMYSLLNKNYKARYHSEKYIYHPIKEPNLSRALNYGLGFGALMKKEMLYRKNYDIIITALEYIIFRPILGVAISFLKFNISKTKMYFNTFIGRVRGFFSYEQ